jgi:hypothetical protein
MDHAEFSVGSGGPTIARIAVEKQRKPQFFRLSAPRTKAAATQLTLRYHHHR